MSLKVLPSYQAIAVNLTFPFAGQGGTEPYSYSVEVGGAGGSIDASTGVYTSSGATGLDTIVVTDADGNTASAEVLVGSPLELLCDVIQTELGLARGRVYLWDQKIMAPSDNGLFVAVGVLSCKPFSNSRKTNSAGNSVQSVNMKAMVSIDVISRGNSAVDRKEEIIMALNSYYAESQQELNSFRIFPVSHDFVNLSQPEGAAIPYRFNIGVALHYFVTKTKAAPYFDTFEDVEITTEP